MCVFFVDLDELSGRLYPDEMDNRAFQNQAAQVSLMADERSNTIGFAAPNISLSFVPS
jgi:hypothetical protein